MSVSGKKSFLLMLLFVVASFNFNCKMISRMTAKSGSAFIVQVETNEPNKDEIFQQAINKLESEMNVAGINGEVSKIPDKPYQLAVKIYEPKDIERDKKFLFTNYQLELKKLVSQPNPTQFQQYLTEELARQQATENQEILPYVENYSERKSFVIVEKEPIVSGKDVRMANASQEMSGAKYYAIQFSLKKEAAEKFGSWTTRNINNYLAVVLNKQVTSVAFIKSPIYDSGQIDGRFTKENAEDIAFNLNSGHLPVTFNVLSETVFGK